MKNCFRTSLLKFLAIFITLTIGSLAVGASKAKPTAGDKKPPVEASAIEPKVTTEIPTEIPTEVTAEQRQQMATVHEKMATCIRSDKSMEDCHKEMMDSHKDFMGKGSHCPMHGMHGKKEGCCRGAGGKHHAKKGGSCADHHAHHGGKAEAPATEKK